MSTISLRGQKREEFSKSLQYGASFHIKTVLHFFQLKFNFVFSHFNFILLYITCELKSWIQESAKNSFYCVTESILPTLSRWKCFFKYSRYNFFSLKIYSFHVSIFILNTKIQYNFCRNKSAGCLQYVTCFIA